MADSAASYCLGPSARASSTHRKAAGTKQTRTLKPEDASRRRAELEAAVQRKVECERKAVRMVEQLLEENITEEFLKECGMFITPAHYSDVVDERAIIKLCGYPLCQKTLGAIPKQKYKISTKTNKVYDITERKSFCSNFCYRASKFFEAQIPKTPVWVREEERPPDFQLLKEGQSGRSGEVVQFFRDTVTAADIDGPGAREAQCEATAPSTWCDHTTDDEQDFVSSLLPGHGPKAANTRPQPHRESSIRKRKAGQKGTSRPREQTVADVTERLGNCRLDGQEKVAACELPSKKENTQISSPGPPSAVSDSRHSVSEVTLVGSPSLPSVVSNNRHNVSEVTLVGSPGPPSAVSDSRHSVSEVTLVGSPSPPSVVSDNRHSVSEVTLVGSPSPPLVVSDNRHNVSEVTLVGSPGPPSAVSDSRHSLSEVTLVGISKKSAEHFRVKFARSNQEFGPASGPGQACPEVAKAHLLRVLKDTLTEWKTEETLKFLYGPDHASVCPKPPSAPVADDELDEDDLSCDPASCGPAVSQPQNNLDETLPFRGSDTATKPMPSYESLKKETEMLNLRVREFYRGRYVLNEEATKSQDPGENVSQRDPSFPLIDSSSQNQIRRRIVLEKLSKVLPGLLGPLQITIGDVYSELKSLVQTFRLSNRNIIHKPVEWTLISVVLLTLLTPILGIQKQSPKNVVFTQFITTLLTELNLKCEDLENLTTIFRTSC